MKRTVSLFLFIFALSVVFVAGQGKPSTPNKLWREADDAALQQRQLERVIIPNAYRAFTLDKTALKNVLRKAPLEFTEAARNNSEEITIPMPDGTFARFSIEESPIVESGLAAKYPEIKTYRGRGIDDPTLSARFDFLPKGFHGIIFSSKGTILVDPYAVGDTGNYISYYKHEVERTGEFACRFKDEVEQLPSALGFAPDAPSVGSGTNLRTYRLALAATAEYTDVFRVAGDTNAQAKARALSEMIIIMNRVNGVYERDVAIRMILVNNQDSIIYTDSATDPYTNENGSAMLGQNQANLDSVIGDANYDIGHVFSTGGGGIAGLGVPCRSNLKARGVTGSPYPIGDPFSIDYVAHEIGHQFGAHHTFNTGAGSCGAQRTAGAAYEPGSGITIMAYAGLCGSQNLALNSIDTFHVKSIEQIVQYSTSGLGNGCSVSTATGNALPEVSVESGFNLPKQTPFYLTATASDANNDPLTYDWQQYDLGAASMSAAGNSDADGQERPLFRPYLPTTEATRMFPSKQFILNNANVPPTSTGGRLTGEILPSMTRTMLFQVIVRDNRAGTGGVRSRTAAVNIDATSGPFIITAPDTAVSWNGNSSETITWNVANTNNAIVDAQNVKISLSTDGGNTFPIVIAASTANDGSETITVPNVTTTQARIRIEAVGNIFFDISGANFSITASTTAPNRTAFDFDGDGKADVSVFRPSTGTWYLSNSQSGFYGAQFGASGDKIVPADFDGDRKTDLAVYRNGTWFIQRSQAGFLGFQFGDANDITAPADVDGDGKAEIVVFRPSTGTWYVYNLANNQVSSVSFGQTGDVPVLSDFDGDGKANFAVFRPSAGTWYIARATGVPAQNFDAVTFGANGDKAVPADFDGDGKTDVAVFRPSTGIWYIMRSRDGLTGVHFGASGDFPTAADYDGDGKADVAVFRSGTWYINRSQAGFTGVAFGASTDQAAPNAFIR